MISFLLKKINTKVYIIMTEDSFEKVTDFGNLYIAYKKARQGKGSKDSKARFGSVALDGIYQLKKMLICLHWAFQVEVNVSLRL